ncbi:MAG: cadherin-like domain-containing protein, partial [Acidobacteriota bacterium]
LGKRGRIVGTKIILGSINCNDDGPGNSGACSIRINVSGNLTMDPGSAIYAENRRGSGSGGDITITTGGNLILAGTLSNRPGAIISSAGAAGGKVTGTIGGLTRLEAGSIISSAATKGMAGAIVLIGQGPVEVRGLVAAGPGVTSRHGDGEGHDEGDDEEGNHDGEHSGDDGDKGDDDGDDLSCGGGSKMGGGNITITSSSRVEPGVLVTGSGQVISQGEGLGAGTVTVSACGVEIRGRVSSLAKDGNGRVSLRSGTYLRIDSRDLGKKGTTLARFGMVRADSTHGTAGGYVLDLIAASALEVLGSDASACGQFSVTSSPAANDSKNSGGTINAVSFGTLTASGNAFSAGSQHSGNRGGTINIAATGNVMMNTAIVRAGGDYSTSDKTAAGGTINVRSHTGSVAWQSGKGDVRPAGSSTKASAANAGKINITSCGSTTLSGTSFVTQGAAIAPFPKLAQSCTPAAPALPPGETPLTACTAPNQAPTARNDSFTVSEGGTLTVAARGLLANDTDPEGAALTAILVTPPLHGVVTVSANGSFIYVHDGSETTSDSFQYKASDGSADSNLATVSIVVVPVNDPPTAVDDTYSMLEGGSIFVTAPGFMANDFDPDSPVLVASLVQGPAHGTLTFHPDGSFVYSHDGTQTLTDSFKYQLSDGLASSPVATVSFNVTPVDDPPVANDDTYSVKRGGTLTVAAPGVMANDTDEEHDPLTAVLFDPPLHGTVTLNPDGSFTYVHDGSAATSDEFSYNVREPNNNSPIAYVTIIITP